MNQGLFPLAWIFHTWNHPPEAWTMTTSDKAFLGVFQRKRVPMRLMMSYELYGDIDLVQGVKIQWLRWQGHDVRMDTNAPAPVPAGGSKGRERPPLRWKDQIEKNLASFGVSNWRRLACKRNVWRSLLNSA